jgi:hypothetical protein
MSEILYKIQAQFAVLFSTQNDETQLTRVYDQTLVNQGDDFFHPFITYHPHLKYHYSLLCTQIAFIVNKEELKEEDRERLNKLLTDALAWSEILAHIYSTYLIAPNEVHGLQKNQKIYRSLLEMQGIRFRPPYYNGPVSANSMTKVVRDGTAFWTFPRLMLVRIRRLFLILVPILANAKNYANFIAFLDVFFAPLLSYLAWVYFVPRLAVNVFLLLKHLIPGFWMSDTEASVSWWIRLEAQLQRRGFELANDVVWLIAGALGCFLLVGTAALAAAGMYVTIAAFFFDVLMAGLKVYLELNRLNVLFAEYEDRLLAQQDLHLPERAEVGEYLHALRKRYCYERKILLLRVISTLALFLGMLFALPTLTIPGLPLAGAVIVIVVTLLTFLMDKWLEKHKPAETVDANAVNRVRQGFAKSSCTFFADKPDLKESATDGVRRCQSLPHIVVPSEMPVGGM